MEKNTRFATVNDCNMSGVRPVMTPLPYPPIQVKCRNRDYADLLSADYCGGVSELSAITQYINNENRLSCEHCALAKILLGIAMAEMMLWTPACLDIPEKAEEMLRADIEAEKAAIGQYKKHIGMIDDYFVNTTLARIIEDEEYHIMLLQDLLKGL